MPNYENFTEANVRKLRSRVTTGRVEYQAKDLPALHLRISPTSASWYVRKRVPGGSWVRVLLGKVDDMSVDAARKLALKAVGKLVDGQDLAAEKRARKAEEERKGLTLGEGLAIYLGEREQLRPATKATYERDLRITFGDYWDKPLVDLTPERVKDRHRDRKTKDIRAQAKVKSAGSRKKIKASPARADGAVRALRAIVNYLRDERGLDLPDVARRIRATKGWGNVSPRQRAFIGDALPEFVASVRGLGDDLPPDLTGTQRDLTLLLLCTALRWSSAAGLLWSEVDFKAKVITVPEDRMKGKEMHSLPLGPVMMAMLKERQKTARSDEYVFPGLGRRAGGKTVYKAIGRLSKAYFAKV
ncbi:MAG TPA: integrase arm-type DNA-binding domain-containing protein, partial [Lysobacter sp.]